MSENETPVWTPQTWKGMDGATAWHLIDRHADDWSEIGQMMQEWLDANQRDDPQAKVAALEAELERYRSAPVVWMQSTHLKMFETLACGSSMMLARCSFKQAQSDFVPLYRHPPVSQDKLDAERYRWLREQNASLDKNTFYVGQDIVDSEPDDIAWIGSDLDAAIDAAMKEQGK